MDFYQSSLSDIQVELDNLKSRKDGLLHELARLDEEISEAMAWLAIKELARKVAGY